MYLKKPSAAQHHFRTVSLAPKSQTCQLLRPQQLETDNEKMVSGMDRKPGVLMVMQMQAVGRRVSSIVRKLGLCYLGMAQTNNVLGMGDTEPSKSQRD